MKPSTWSLIVALLLLTQFHPSFGTQQTTTLELSISRRTIEFGERVTLTAVLQNSRGSPVQGAQIFFFADDEFLGRQTTATDGIARFSLSPDLGATILIAEFAATEGYLSSTSDAILLEVSALVNESQDPSFEPLSTSAIFLISILTLGGVGSIVIYVYSKSTKKNELD